MTQRYDAATEEQRSLPPALRPLIRQPVSAGTSHDALIHRSLAQVAAARKHRLTAAANDGAVRPMTDKERWRKQYNDSFPVLVFLDSALERNVGHSFEVCADFLRDRCGVEICTGFSVEGNGEVSDVVCGFVLSFMVRALL